MKTQAGRAEVGPACLHPSPHPAKVLGCMCPSWVPQRLEPTCGWWTMATRRDFSLPPNTPRSLIHTLQDTATLLKHWWLNIMWKIVTIKKNKQKKNLSPLLTSLPNKWSLQENSQSDKKSQFVLGLSLAHVRPAAWGQSQTASNNQGCISLSPQPGPEAETGSVALD